MKINWNYCLFSWKSFFLKSLNKNKLWICALFGLADSKTKPFSTTWWCSQCAPTRISAGQSFSTATEFRWIFMDGRVISDFFRFGIFLESFQIATDYNSITYRIQWNLLLYFTFVGILRVFGRYLQLIYCMVEACDMLWLLLLPQIQRNIWKWKEKYWI